MATLMSLVKPAADKAQAVNHMRKLAHEANLNGNTAPCEINFSNFKIVKVHDTYNMDIEVSASAFAAIKAKADMHESQSLRTHQGIEYEPIDDSTNTIRVNTTNRKVKITASHSDAWVQTRISKLIDSLTSLTH